MKFRFLLISLLVALMVIMPAATSAQDLDTCFNLSDEDCAVIDEASLGLAFFAMSSESFSIEYDLSFSATGLPEETAGATSAAFDSSGAIDIVLSGNGAIPVTLGALFENDFGMGEMMMSLPFEIRLVDDYVYFLDPMSGDWQGFNLAAEMEDPEFGEQLDGIMGGGDSGMPDVESLLAISVLFDLPGFVDYTRDGDDFIFTMDLTALGTLADPANADKLAAIAEVMNEVNPGAGDSLTELVPLIPMLLSEGTITIVQSVNTELGIVEAMSFDVALTVDGTMFTGSPDPIEVDLIFDMEITNVNSAPAAAAPAEWEEVDPGELLGGM